MKTIKNLTAEEIRKSILQLAIQGKLVKQDPNDEPASELVKRIYAEKQKLIKEGKIKKDKNESYIYKGDDNCYYEKIGKSEPVKLNDLPFEIPDSWCWIRISSAYLPIETGVQRYEGKKDYYSTGSIVNEIYTPEGAYAYEHRPSRANRICYKGDLIEAKMQSTNKCTIIDEKLDGALFSTGFFCFRAIINSIEYLKNYINSDYFQKTKDSLCSGVTQKAINDDKLFSILLPLPPLNEQYRINEKVTRLLPLIELYRRQEADLSLLETSFEEKLKASILQYAIEGKLVKQDSNDEPASVLLERIKAEKEKLIKEGKIKRDKYESNIVIGDDKNYYEKLPASWKTISLNDVCSLISRGKTPKYSDNGKVLVLAQKCNQWDGIHLDRCLKTEVSELIRYTDSYLLKVGDIVINSTGGGTVGRTGYVSNSIIKEQQVVWDTHITVVRPMLKMNSKFVYLFLISPIIQTGIEKKCEGSTNQIELYSKVIKSYRIPLPPFNEQSKIVNKIDKIFSSI